MQSIAKQLTDFILFFYKRDHSFDLSFLLTYTIRKGIYYILIL